MGLLLAGFADEAAKGLREQIAIHKQQGIQALEIRLVNDVNIGQMDDRQFEEVYRIVQEEEYQICGFGSAIANWARPITTDFALSGSLEPGSSTTILSSPCVVMEGSETPNLSILFLSISITRRMASFISSAVSSTAPCLFLITS